MNKNQRVIQMRMRVQEHGYLGHISPEAFENLAVSLY